MGRLALLTHFSQCIAMLSDWIETYKAKLESSSFHKIVLVLASDEKEKDTNCMLDICMEVVVRAGGG